MEFINGNYELKCYNLNNKYIMEANNEKIKIGIFGARRGMHYASHFMMNGCDIVAVCENRKQVMDDARESLGKSVAFYDDFDSFIEHDMDAVIVANFFHQHVPYVIKCFEKGIHVFCGCISNATMAEGVELVRAFEKSDSIYMLAENYPHMKFNREMKRVVETGTLGGVLYAEGEYNHPVAPTDIEFVKVHTYSPKHWRNYIPATYYITHSLGPVMYATGATPKRVTAFSVFAPEVGGSPMSSHVGDAAAIITTQNNDGSIFRLTGCASFGGHHNSYRVCGTEGQIENLRGMDDRVMLRYNEWSKDANTPEASLYDPGSNDKDEKLIMQSGHGGGDFITARMFVECIRDGKQPCHPFDIYSAVNMASVGILAHRSVLEGGKPYDIPDFHNEECCIQYENDRLTPFYGPNGEEPTLPCSSHPDYKPSEERLKIYRELID